MSEGETGDRWVTAELVCPGPYHAAALVIWLRERRPDLELVEVKTYPNMQCGVLVAGRTAGVASLAMEQRSVNGAVDQTLERRKAASPPGRVPGGTEELPHDSG